MNTTVMTLLVVVGIIVIAGAAWMYWQSRRRVHLRDRFGSEYDRTVDHMGDARRAEAALSAREKRVEKLNIHPLPPEESARYAEVWRHVQALFVDDPKGAIGEADRLVNDVMTARGYPMADFDQRLEDISVDHGNVVEHYRSARAIARRERAGTVTTEELRQALVHYRALFDDLLGKERKPEPARR